MIPKNNSINVSKQLNLAQVFIFHRKPEFINRNDPNMLNIPSNTDKKKKKKTSGNFVHGFLSGHNPLLREKKMKENEEKKRVLMEY